MKLSFSHIVLYVSDQSKMLDFYTRILGFKVTDQGPLAEGAPDIVFLSNDPEEHHQIAMIQVRQDDKPSNTLNHFAFRVERFEEVIELNRTLQEITGIDVNPLSHGNTLSIYFNDLEGNGIEVFWDTPWHVDQPQGKSWDPSLRKQAVLSWVEENFKDEAGFEPRADYYQHRHLR